MKNYYLILGLNEDADYSAIKTAYRDRCKDFHPDTSSCDGEEFLNIHDAYEVLSDPTRRREYDRELSRFRDRQNTSKYNGESIQVRRSAPNSIHEKRFTGRGGFFEDDLFSRFSSFFDDLFSFTDTPYSQHFYSQKMHNGPPRGFYHEELACQLVLSPEEASKGGTFSMPLPTRPKKTVHIEIPERIQGGEQLQFDLWNVGLRGVVLTIKVLVER